MLNHKKTAIVAFAFGKPASITPNQIIGFLSICESQEHQAIIYAQKDIDVSSEIENRKIRYVSQQDNDSPSTLEIAQQAVKWAKKDKIHKFVVVTAWPHMNRCLRDLRKTVKENFLDIEVIALAGRSFNIHWFSQYSDQFYTRHKFAWVVREILVRLLPFGIYKSLTT